MRVLLGPKVGNPLREQGLGLKDMVSLLGALVRGFTKVCPRDNLLRSDEPGMVDAWRRYGVLTLFSGVATLRSSTS